MRSHAAMAMLSAAILAGCASTPRAHAPQNELPEHYSAGSAAPAQISADGVTQHFTSGARPTPQWWTRYQSEALNALVDEGLAHSASLAAAEATLKATREALREQIGDNLYPSIDLGFAPSRQRALTIPTLPQETFLYNVFALEAQASYKFDFFGAYIYADRALAQQVEQQAFQFDATRRAWRRTS